MSWFNRFKAAFEPAPRPRLIHDPDLLAWLQQIAHEEHRPLDAVAQELLYQALRQRQLSDHSLTLWQQLTPREQQTAALTCLGYTNHEIAQQMIISPNTVKTHMRSILTKLELNSKSDLSQMLTGWDFRAWLASQNLHPTPQSPPTSDTSPHEVTPDSNPDSSR